MTELSLKSGGLSDTWTPVHWCWGCFKRQWGLMQTRTFLSPKRLCWEKADSLLKLEESEGSNDDLRWKWFCWHITCWQVYFICNTLGTVKYMQKSIMGCLPSPHKFSPEGFYMEGFTFLSSLHRASSRNFSGCYTEMIPGLSWAALLLSSGTYPQRRNRVRLKWLRSHNRDIGSN